MSDNASSLLAAQSIGGLYSDSVSSAFRAPVLARCQAIAEGQASTVTASVNDALATAVAPVSPSACPAGRPTLASTAALFLPDQASPILLAPSEAEIQSDPQYYNFGAKLVVKREAE